MTLDEAITALLAEIPEAYKGDVAKFGHRNDEAAKGYSYRRCDCTYRDASYGWHEYIAEGTNGKHVAAINLKPGSNRHYGKVTVGQNGYHTSSHTHRPSEQACC